jgi:hypothetical protein
MRLTPEDVAAGVSLGEAREHFAQWAGTAPVAAWTQSSLDWSRTVRVPGAPTAALKIAYSNLRNRGAGLLEEVLRREGLAWASNDCRGRARDRLGNALAVARWLQAMRRELVAAFAGEAACS